MSKRLVTGSRDWKDCDVVWRALGDVVTSTAQPITIVHGACPSGADLHADRFATEYADIGIIAERHPAQGHPTQDFGPWPAAGPRRNAYMVSLGADLCLAFIGPCTSPRCHHTEPHPSHGASNCAQLAEDAGIPTRRWT